MKASLVDDGVDRANHQEGDVQENGDGVEYQEASEEWHGRRELNPVSLVLEASMLSLHHAHVLSDDDGFSWAFGIVVREIPVNDARGKALAK